MRDQERKSIKRVSENENAQGEPLNKSACVSREGTIHSGSSQSSGRISVGSNKECKAKPAMAQHSPLTTRNLYWHENNEPRGSAEFGPSSRQSSWESRRDGPYGNPNYLPVGNQRSTNNPPRATVRSIVDSVEKGDSRQQTKYPAMAINADRMRNNRSKEAKPKEATKPKTDVTQELVDVVMRDVNAWKPRTAPYEHPPF